MKRFPALMTALSALIALAAGTLLRTADPPKPREIVAAEALASLMSAPMPAPPEEASPIDQDDDPDDGVFLPILGGLPAPVTARATDFPPAKPHPAVKSTTWSISPRAPPIG